MVPFLDIDASCTYQFPCKKGVKLAQKQCPNVLLKHMTEAITLISSCCLLGNNISALCLLGHYKQKLVHVIEPIFYYTIAT